MREDELLGHIYGRSRGLPARFPAVIVGPGHDCAVVATGGGRVLLKVDQVVEGRHFRSGTPLDLVARKAMARPLSDLAACGGTPVAGLCAATLPERFAEGDALFDAVARWAERWACPLVGGDLALGAAGSALSLCVSVMGTPHAMRGPVLRDGARPGDGVYVTGALGGSLDAATGLGRHLTFEPRLAEARWLCDTLGRELHAMMDVSDGLGRDGGRMAAASGVRLRLEAGAIPRSAGVADWRRAVSDGEDYELLFTTPTAMPGKTLTGVTITRIGTVEAGSGCVIADGGREIDAAEMGWEHGRN
jgi:thiamine-monophosphate kinase